MTFSDRIWSAVLETWVMLFAIVGLTASLIVFFVVPTEDTVPLNIVVVIMLLGFIVLSFFARAAYDANQDAQVTPPKIIMVIDPPTSYNTASALLLIEPTELLSFDSLVSLYYMDDGFEKFYGVGQVINIQNDKKVQVLLLNAEVSADTVEGLKKNSKEVLARLIVKPSVASNFLRGGE